MKHVCLVFHEPLIRNLVHAILARTDFTVNDIPACVESEVPHECNLRCCADHPEPDLLVMEVITPRRCSGVDAAHQALRRWPGVKVLLTSASSMDVWPTVDAQLFSALPSGSCAFLSKPFTRSRLLSAVPARRY